MAIEFYNLTIIKELKMENEKKQELFNYFQQEHDIMLMECDFNEIEKILKRKLRDHWYCSNCGKTLHPGEVTFEEEHDRRIGGCGMPVTFIQTKNKGK